MTNAQILDAFIAEEQQTGQWHPAWESFLERLHESGVDYTNAQIVSAWYWFREGWDAA